MQHFVLNVLLIFFVGVSGYSQTPLPSIFLTDSSTGGEKAAIGASQLEGSLLSDLMKDFPCIDMMDRLGAEGMLELQRKVDLLGGEPNSELLAQVGGAIGARYVVSVQATQMPNGAVYMRVVVVDSTTGKPVMMDDAPPSTDTFATAESLKRKVLAGLGKYLQGKCDEHWTGTITYRFRLDKSGTPQNVKPPATGEERTTKIDNMDIVLRPMSLGSTNPSMPGAKITRHFEYHQLRKREEPAKVMCRPRGANSYWRNTTYAHSVTHDETGDVSVTRSVFVDYRQDGTYVIKVVENPYPLKATYTHEVKERPTGGCEDPPPFTAITKGENDYPPPFLLSSEVKGRWDPKDPDVLRGTFTNGNGEEGVATLKWELRRVKPKSRLQK